MSVEKPIYPRVKICGITNMKDAMMAAYMGADAIGLIQVPKAKRAIDKELAKTIVQSLPLFVSTVAVFQDADADEVNETADFLNVDYVQLHGNESSEYCSKILKRIIKRIDIEDLDSPESLTKKMTDYKVTGYLLDPGAGSGQVFDWSCTIGLEIPFILAGGLNPDNIRQAIRVVQPYGVDVSSGVEEVLRKKDPEKVRQFIMEAKS